MLFCCGIKKNSAPTSHTFGALQKEDVAPDVSFPKYKRASYAASLSVEAAVVTPVFMFALAALIQIMVIIGTYCRVSHSLYKQTLRVSGFTYLTCMAEDYMIKQLDMEDYKAIENIVANGVSELLVKKMVEDDLGEEFLSGALIKDGLSVKVSLSGGGGVLDVILAYRIKLLFNIFGIDDYEMITRARTNCWVGTTKVVREDKSESSKVYITKHGVVYHIFDDCPYIDIKVTGVTPSKIGAARNESGGIYYPCSRCVNGNEVVFYITKYGDKYHGLGDCGAIYRNVEIIDRDEIGERRLCSKCAKRSEESN